MKKNKEVRNNTAIPRFLILILTSIIIVFLTYKAKDFESFTSLGYIGILLLNFISSASVIFPMPGTLSVLWGGAVWNPILVGLFSGIGASLGEVSGYLLGFGSRGFLHRLEKKNEWFLKIEYFFHKTGFMTIVIVSLLPLPIFDFIGILAGGLNYPLWKFLIATSIGRIIRNLLIAWTGAKFLPF